MYDLVSIIIPAKDRIDWLKETLKSVFNQTYSEIEVIIIDDGSKPPIQECLPQLKENMRVSILRNEVSSGCWLCQRKRPFSSSRPVY